MTTIARPQVEVRAVSCEQVICGALVLGLVYRDAGRDGLLTWRWVTRRAWGASRTRDAALMRIIDRVRTSPPTKGCLSS